MLAFVLVMVGAAVIGGIVWNNGGGWFVITAIILIGFIGGVVLATRAMPAAVGVFIYAWSILIFAVVALIIAFAISVFRDGEFRNALGVLVGGFVVYGVMMVMFLIAQGAYADELQFKQCPNVLSYLPKGEVICMRGNPVNNPFLQFSVVVDEKFMPKG